MSIEVRMAATSVTNRGSSSVCALTLTATPMRPARRCQPLQAVRDCRSTVLVSGPIRPAASARGMNSAGEMAPKAGCVHRASASTPLTEPSLAPTFG